MCGMAAQQATENIGAGLPTCRNLHLPSMSRQQNRAELLSVNPAELDAAVEKDRIGRAQ